ncbi:MAG: MerR family transcriptional regulator [Planctomycetes bacterium]|nr:MerR family transcriptional regulator [Planctomycetota bacterium]MCW8134686.1 MerR family transcriptional regulator [Planctomycetota bacterium]
MSAPPKLYKVGEIMRHTKLSRQTIHNYTMLGLITPVERTESGHRLYDEKVFDRIKKIEMMKIHRTLQEIKETFDAEDAAASQA